MSKTTHDRTRHYSTALEEVRRRQLVYAEAETDAEREVAGLAYAEAQVEALRRVADRRFSRHWPIARADELGSARTDFRSLLRFARTVERSIRALPVDPYGPTAEDARRASEYQARRARLLRVVAAIVTDAREKLELYDKLFARRVEDQWTAIYTRRPATSVGTRDTCRPQRRAQGKRSPRTVLRRRRTTRGSPARPEPEPAPASRRPPHHLDPVVLRGSA